MGLAISKVVLGLKSKSKDKYNLKLSSNDKNENISTHCMALRLIADETKYVNQILYRKRPK